MESSKKEKEILSTLRLLGLDNLEKAKAQVTQWLPQDIQELESLLKDSFMQYILKNYPNVREVMDYLTGLSNGDTKPAVAPAVSPA